jgi:signal peptidase
VTGEPETKPEPTLWAYLRLTVSVALLILVGALGIAVIVIPAATGSVPLTVLTSSMEPGLPPGTLLIVRPVDPADIRLGDVVTYQIRSGEPDVITHRVIAITSTTSGELSFTTQGDNNGGPDPEQVREVQIQGRLWYSVPWLGWVNNAAGGELRSVVLPIIAIGLILYGAWMVVSGLLSRKKDSQRAADVPSPHADDT